MQSSVSFRMLVSLFSILVVGYIDMRLMIWLPVRLEYCRLLRLFRFFSLDAKHWDKVSLSLHDLPSLISSLALVSRRHWFHFSLTRLFFCRDFGAAAFSNKSLRGISTITRISALPSYSFLRLYQGLPPPDVTARFRFLCFAFHRLLLYISLFSSLFAIIQVVHFLLLLDDIDDAE